MLALKGDSGTAAEFGLAFLTTYLSLGSLRMTYRNYIVFSVWVPGLFCGQALKGIGNLSPFYSKTLYIRTGTNF